VTGAGNEAGGSITMLVAPPTGTQLIVVRNVPATQETDYLANDPFPAESHERALDKLTMLVQQNKLESDRALKVPLASLPTTDTELPIPVGNKLLAWNSDASAIVNFDPADVITVTGQQNSYADVFTGNGVTTSFTLTRNPGTVFNIDVSINGVTQVPNVDYILAATTLTFTSAPPAVASQVLARYSEVFTLVDGDAANIRYLPAGGVQTNVQAKLRETVSVKDFGAVGDGVTDDSAAFQAAHNSFSSIGGAIYIPTGTYAVNATVNFTKPIYMYGDGGGISTGISKLVCNTASIDVFTTTNLLICDNFAIQGQFTNTLFKQLNTATNNVQTRFSNLAVLNCFRFFESQASLVFYVIDSWIGGFVNAAIYINNGAGTSEDQGDSFIKGNSFLAGGTNVAVGIDIVRGAGFWISGNKFNSSAAIAHVRANVGSGNPTGNLLIEHNSFEGQASFGIDVSASDVVTKVIVANNQFSGGVGRHVNFNSNVWEAVIEGNTFNGLTSTPLSSEVGIYIGSATRDVTVQGNNFHKIDTCITTDDASPKILDNTFGDDIAVIQTGTIKNKFNLRQSYSRHFLSRYRENASNSVWLTIFKIPGVSLVLDIAIDGFVQGLGDFKAYYRTFDGTNVVTPILTGAGASNFDFQILATGEIQFKRTGSGGTIVQLTARIVATGGITGVAFS
jgi:hypothetical protein